MRRPNPYPGTDDLTGWPVEPKEACVKDSLGLPEGAVICHLRLGGEPFVCVYEPGDCPFFGREPRVTVTLLSRPGERENG